MSDKPKPENYQKIIDTQVIAAEIYAKYPASLLFTLGPKALGNVLKEVEKAGAKGQSIMLSAKPTEPRVASAGAGLFGQMQSYGYMIRHLITIQEVSEEPWKALQESLKGAKFPNIGPMPLHPEDAYGKSGKSPIEA